MPNITGFYSNEAIYQRKVLDDRGSYHPVRKFQRKLHLFVVLKHVLVNYCNKGSQATQVGSHGIEASYDITNTYVPLPLITDYKSILLHAFDHNYETFLLLLIIHV